MILNYTPHEVTIVGLTAEGNYGVVRRVPPSGLLVRLRAITVPAGEVDGVPLTRTEYGEAEGFPEFKEGTYLIVSALVKNAFPARPDLLVTAEVVRDKNRNVIGCRSLGL